MSNMPKDKLLQIINEEKAKDRWGDCIPHHIKSLKLMAFLSEVDYQVYGDHFCWKTGGDGDNGETLMYQMDAYFENED